jgi:nicotinate-nucleotide adenylyltransferase
VPRRRIAIFGGTFDPPHLGHLIVASDACEALHVDRLLFVPAADPPHKRGSVVASGERRRTMVATAIAGDDRFDVDDLELRRGGVSFTVDTLRELSGRHPDAELVFLLGVDQFLEFSTWREPEEIARLATLGVLARGGETIPPAGPFGGVPVPVRRIDISATEIRQRIAAGQSVRYLLPESVLAIIERQGLYGNAGS